MESRCVVKSPDGDLSLRVQQQEGEAFTYTLAIAGEEYIAPSQLGFVTTEGEIFPNGSWSITNVARESHKGVWEPLWGKRTSVADVYNQTTITLSAGEESTLGSMKIEIRAYDDGVALRYIIPEELSEDIKVKGECTQFNFADDYTAWYYNNEHPNIGPEKLSESSGRRLPVVTIKAGEEQYMAIHEAYLQYGEPMVLTSKEGETLLEVVSSPRRIFAGFESGWRVIFCGNTPGEMVDSHLLELLNPDPDPSMDFSWVKTGLATWDWRINGAQVDGFLYTMSYPSWVKMVDFSAENGIPYLVLDANWYGPEFEEDSDPMVGDKASDVKRLIEYAKDKGVGIWLYLNDVGGRNFSIDDILKQYGQWGAAGVKYGFMRGNTMEKMERTQMITLLCAENRLLINYHDAPVHPYGQMRTWPNAVTREYCHAQLDAHRVFQPTTFVTSVFVNMIAGPIDMNNGMFDLRQGNTTREDENQPVPSTVVSEAARTAIVFSGATIIPDIPEFYCKYPSLLRFISAQQMPWVESKTLAGVIGEYIIMMRETKEHYLVAAAINEEGGSITIPLDFLPAGEFSAELSTDSKEAHYLTNRETLDVEQITGSANQPLEVKLAQGGGCCLLIKK